MIEHHSEYNPLVPRPDGGSEETSELEATKKVVTRRQYLFVQYFFRFEMDGVRAAVAAGYRGDPAAVATRLLAHPHISEEIFTRLKRIQEADDVSLKGVIETLWAEARSRGGNDESQSARVAALDKLARLLGGYEKGAAVPKPVVAINMDFSDGE